MNQVSFLEEAAEFELEGEDLKSSWGEESHEGGTKMSSEIRVFISQIFLK